MKNLTQKIGEGKAVVGVVGLGHVGLPLAMAFSKAYTVHGFDTDQERIKSLKDGHSHTRDVPDSLLQSISRTSFFPTSEEEVLGRCDFVIIAVPTPLRASKEPDLRFIREATEIVGRNLREGQFVILESTTYPGTTEEIVVPILEKSGLRAGQDFGVAYSPERFDPGNTKFPIESIPKIVSGINPACTEIASQLYDAVVDRVIPVSNCKTAEATKMLENIFRVVNIATINEMALIFERMGIDTWEVVEAAATKPYGFMPFFPGPGVGGHCVPLDPYYMAYRAKQVGIIPRFIELSGEVNEFMRFHVVSLLVEGLVQAKKVLPESEVALLGLAYKRDIGDTREAPAMKIIPEILRHGGRLRVYDPLAERIETEVGVFESTKDIEEACDGVDALVLLTDHREFQGLDYRKLVMRRKDNPVIIDTRNMLKAAPPGTVYVGLGKGRHLMTA